MCSFFVGCGGNYNQLTGVIQSTNYPSSYNPNSNCIYTIEIPQGYVITLEIQTLSIESTAETVGGCHADALEVSLVSRFYMVQDRVLNKIQNLDPEISGLP